MKAVTAFSEETISEAARLLAADSEMLHRYESDGGALPRCIYCAGVKMYRDYDEECPALLRASLSSLRAELSASEEKEKGLRERADNFRGALVRAEVAIMTRTYSADGSEWRGCPVCRRAMTEHTPECPFALLSA